MNGPTTCPTCGRSQGWNGHAYARCAFFPNLIGTTGYAPTTSDQHADDVDNARLGVTSAEYNAENDLRALVCYAYERGQWALVVGAYGGAEHQNGWWTPTAVYYVESVRDVPEVLDQMGLNF